MVRMAVLYELLAGPRDSQAGEAGVGQSDQAPVGAAQGSGTA